jgi:ketosteroid isomerase-like protein
LLWSARSDVPRSDGRSRDPRQLLDGSPRVAHTRCISEDAVAEVSASERLARRWFALVEQGALDQLVDLVHPDVLLVSKVRPGLVVEGREDFARFVDETLAKSLHESVTDIYQPVDERCIIVEGRLRWIDDERVIRDDPVTWALEFEDGLLLRFIPARTSLEAEAILATPRGDVDSTDDRV